MKAVSGTFIKSAGMAGGIFLLLTLCVHAKTASATRIPENVVSLNLCTDEMLLEIAPEDSIAALTWFSADPQISSVSGRAAPFKKIRGTAEEVIRLHPDLVFAEPFSRRETLLFLEKMKVPVVRLPLPADFSEVKDHYKAMAARLGSEDLARKQVQTLQAFLDNLEPVQRDAPGVLFLNRGGQTAGAGTFEDAVLEAAGVRNLARDLGIKGHAMIGLEQIVMLKPDFIIFSDRMDKILSVGHELLWHPVIRSGLGDARYVFVPLRMLNCAGVKSVKLVRILKWIFEKYEQPDESRKN